jgi:phosphinothricin acetyltransferase
VETACTIRMATPADAKAILDIYAPYIMHTAITFEYYVPSVSEFSNRIRSILTNYPFIVALEHNQIIGYAYASALKERAAYRWAAETTIYLKQDCRGFGIGSKLYLTLETILKKQNILNLNACIAYTSDKDNHLTNASMYFHEQLGYKKVGHFSKCGYKFGTWYDIIWMEKIIGEHLSKPKALISITDLQTIE